MLPESMVWNSWHGGLAALLTVTFMACGTESRPDDGGDARSTERTEAREHAPPPSPSPSPSVEPAHCSQGVSSCRAATGRIVYVEAVDPDGDGDAHFVLASADGVTAPGISVIDVAAQLRPNPLPEIGDAISAAGPVYRGSYGQKQIEATELNVARAPDPGR